MPKTIVEATVAQAIADEGGAPELVVTDTAVEVVFSHGWRLTVSVAGDDEVLLYELDRP